MDMLKWLEEIKQQKIKKPMPILSFPGTQLAGISVKDSVTNADAQVKCIKAIADRYDTAVAVGPMDLSVEAEMFGCEIAFSDKEVPTVIRPAFSIDDEQPLKNLRMPKIGSGRSGVYIEAVKKAKEVITDRPFFAGCIGPFSLAGRLFSLEDVMIACVDEPDMMEELMEKLTFFITEYVLALKAAGADGVIMAEPAAGLLSPSLNAEYSEPFVAKIAAEVQSRSFIMTYHNCGPYVTKQIGNIMDTGCKIFHFGDAIDLADICPFIPDNVLLSGNVSPVEYFKLGSSDDMKNVVLSVLKKCGNMNNFIPSSGCDVPADAKFENIDCFFKTIEDFYKGKSL